MNKTKLLVLFLQYDQVKYPSAFVYLQKHLAQLTCQQNIVIIDNKIETDINDGNFNSINKNTVKISGDNSAWEFSGWMRGLNFAKNYNLKYDAILFVNDSFLFPSPSMPIINDKLIENCIKENGIVGNLFREPNKEYFIGEHNVSEWIRSHCFLISKTMMDDLGTIQTLGVNDIDKCIEKELSFPYFKNDAPVNSALRRHVINWLQGIWHSKFKIDDDWYMFRMKTLAYFNELLLTARIKKLGYKIINV